MLLFSLPALFDEMNSLKSGYKYFEGFESLYQYHFTLTIIALQILFHTLGAPKLRATRHGPL